MFAKNRVSKKNLLPEVKGNISREFQHVTPTHHKTTKNISQVFDKLDFKNAYNDYE